MYNLIKCSNCNTSLGEKYELYILMKNYLYEKNKIKLRDIHYIKNISSNDINISSLAKIN